MALAVVAVAMMPAMARPGTKARRSQGTKLPATGIGTTMAYPRGRAQAAEVEAAAVQNRGTASSGTTEGTGCER